MGFSTSTSSPHSEQLCQSCGTRPARNHLCQIINGRQSTLKLCDVCMRSHAEQTGFDLPTLDGAKCFYCAGVAMSAGMNQAWELASRQQRHHFTCSRCGQLERQFMTEALSGFPADLPPAQAQRIEQIIREVDQRVREHIRSNPNT
jgi:protein-arginine kinase activator protein McsA